MSYKEIKKIDFDTARKNLLVLAPVYKSGPLDFINKPDVLKCVLVANLLYKNKMPKPDFVFYEAPDMFLKSEFTKEVILKKLKCYNDKRYQGVKEISYPVCSCGENGFTGNNKKNAINSDLMLKDNPLANFFIDISGGLQTRKFLLDIVPDFSKSEYCSGMKQLSGYLLTADDWGFKNDLSVQKFYLENENSGIEKLLGSEEGQKTINLDNLDKFLEKEKNKYASVIDKINDKMIIIKQYKNENIK